MAIVAVVVVVLAAGATVAWATTRSPGPTYRMVTATIGSTAATLDSIGTVTPVNQANLNFSTTGTVGAVSVTVGQKVTAGESLATLDTTPLQDAVAAAQSKVDTAQAKLTSDESSQTTGASTASADSPAASTSPAGTPTLVAAATSSPYDPAASVRSSPPPTASAAHTVQADQAALLAAQKQADAGEQTASTDLSAAIGVCTGSGSPGAGAAGTGASGPSSGTGSSGTGTSTGSGSTGAPSPTTCLSALDQVATDQAAVTKDLSAVQGAESTLASAIASSIAAAGGSPGAAPATGNGGGSTSTGNGSGPRASTVRGAGSGSSGSGVGAISTPATPQQLASDQAAVDLATAQLASAETDLSDAGLVSPISGTVASVSIAAGEAVNAGSIAKTGASSAIVVLGPGSYDVSTEIAVTDLPSVVIGQHALVTPDTTGSAVSGTVTAIGLLATTSSGSTTYPVTVAINDPTGLQLISGADANVSIVTRQVHHVTVVPTSAVHTVGANRFVEVLRNGKSVVRRVIVGTIGDTLTQITSGVAPGQQVVLANLAAPLPISNTIVTGRGARAGLGAARFGGAGGLGGGGAGLRGGVAGRLSRAG